MHSEQAPGPGEDPRVPSLRFGVEQGLVPEFFILFQKGVFIDIAAGTSVEDFLENRLGLEPEYIRTRISTIFLNGMPVDDVRSARLSDGSVLALSAAMPGLVGATLRKGGILSPMRSAISYRDADSSGGGARGRVRLKLFNMIMHEAGPDLLRGGIIIPSSEARAIIDALPPGAVFRENLASWPDGETLIELRVETLEGHAG